MPGTTSTALPSFSRDQHHETDAAKRKGGLIWGQMVVVTITYKSVRVFVFVQEQESSAPTIRLTQSLVSLTHNAPVHVEFRCVQSSTVVGVDVRVATDSQPASVVVFAERWICGTPNATQRRTARIRLPAHLAYRPAADNRYSIHVRNASIDAWMLDPVAYADARAYRKFYDAAGDRRDRRDVSVVSPWRRPRRPDVTDRCPSWWEAIRLRLPYRPVCPAELGLYAYYVLTRSRYDA